MKISLLILPFIGLLFFTSGCGITGGVSKQTITYEAEQLGTADVCVNVVFYGMNPEAPHNMAAGAYNWGEFNQTDLQTIRSSFEETFDMVNTITAKEQYDFNFYVQLYALNFSNIRVACLGTIDWCLTKEASIIKEGRLFAAYDSGGELTASPQTLGSGKDKVNRALIEGICNDVLSTTHNLKVSGPVKLSHNTLSSALESLPDQINIAPVMTGSLIIYQGSASTTFRNLSLPQQINWGDVLKLKTPYM